MFQDLDIGSTLVTNPIIVVDPDELFNAIVKFKCIGVGVSDSLQVYWGRCFRFTSSVLG